MDNRVEIRSGPKRIDWVAVGTMIGAIAAVLSALYAVKSANDAAASAGESEQFAQASLDAARNVADVQMITWFRTEYFEILHDATDEQLGKEEDRRARYLHELWGLHYNEFYAFQKGLIEPTVYVTWLDAMRRQYQRGNEDSKYTLIITKAQEREAWETAVTEIGDEAFTNFFSKVLACTNRQEIENLDQLKKMQSHPAPARRGRESGG